MGHRCLLSAPQAARKCHEWEIPARRLHAALPARAEHPRGRRKLKYCYDICFTKPDKRQISQLLMKICELEGIQCEMNALEFLCESVGNE